MESTSTILTLLEIQVANQPEGNVLTLLHNGETPTESLTYSQLAQQARRIAAFLLRSGVTPGDRVLLVYIEGLEFLPAFLGCLYAGVVAVPTPAPDALRSKRSLPHMQAVYADARARLVLTTERLKEQLPVTPDLPILTTEDRLANESMTPESEDSLPVIQPNQLAYLQYTSGSTGTPKGVMISHANVLANLKGMEQVWPYTPDAVAVTWMPHTHDFGLVGGLLRPVLCGVPSYIMPPGAFLRKPLRWLKAISRLRVTHCGGASFAFQQCLQQFNPAECADLDLSCWLMGVLGAEPIRVDVLEEFATAFAPYGFSRDTYCPAFGLAEGTLMVTARGPGHDLTTHPLTIEGRTTLLMGCGQPWADTDVRIVDPETRTPVPDGEVGEIWIAGATVAMGYWNRPDETQEAFGNTLIGNTLNGTHYMRTGDLGLMERGILYVTGRLKELLILHGQNYYPQDIEWSIDAAHPLLKNGNKAAFAMEDPLAAQGAERLVIVCEIDPKVAKSADLGAVVQAIRERVGIDLLLTVHAVMLVRRGMLPKTPSGKVQRRASRTAWLNDELESLFTWQLEHAPSLAPGDRSDDLSRGSANVAGMTVPQTLTEEMLAQIWCEVLGVPAVSVTDNFFALGGDSLLVMRLMARVEQRFQRQLPVKNFVFNPTIAHLAAELDTLQAPKPSVSPPPQDGKLVATLTEDEDRVLRQLYDQLGQPEIQREQDDWNAPPPARSRMQRTIQSLPPMVAYRLLRWLVRQPRMRQKYWAGEVATIVTFHSTIDTPVDAATMVENSLFYNLLVRYGFNLRYDVKPNPAVAQIEGLELLQRARDQGRGVILAGSHHLTFPRRFAESPLAQWVQVAVTGIEVHTIQRNLPLDRCMPILFARYLEIAVQALQRGEVVLIFPDGHMGSSSAHEIDFHGRRFRFYVGFAELALLTGATVLPMQGELLPGLPPTMRLLPALDAGDATMPHAARVEQMVTRYEQLLYDNWRTIPWGVPWEQMHQHLARPK